jgi:hypothetical protein
MSKKLVLKKDLIIPAGTVLKNIDGRQSTYIDGNYGYLIGLTNDSCGELIYGFDDLDESIGEWFDVVEESL